MEQENEGNEFWLYDDSALEELGAKKCFEDEEARKSLGESGTLICCELYQDDPLDLWVRFGSKPTKKELSYARWQEVQKFHLDLPSGKLVIEGANAFRCGDAEPDIEGAIVDCEPGVYSVQLWNIDWNATEDEVEDFQGQPYQVLALKKVKKKSKNKLADGVVPWNAPVKIEPWVGKFSFEGGVFRGLYRAEDYWDNMRVNLPRLAGEAPFPLTEGDVLEFECKMGKLKAVYTGVEPLFHWPSIEASQNMARRALEGEPELCYARHVEGQEDLLQFRRLESEDLRFDNHSKWFECSIRKI